MLSAFTKCFLNQCITCLDRNESIARARATIGCHTWSSWQMKSCIASCSNSLSSGGGRLTESCFQMLRTMLRPIAITSSAKYQTIIRSTCELLKIVQKKQKMNSQRGVLCSCTCLIIFDSLFNRIVLMILLQCCWVTTGLSLCGWF